MVSTLPSQNMSCTTQDVDSSKVYTLFGFPTELRNYTYELALSGSQASAHKGSSYTTPSMLLVNKQVYNEAFPIFYAAATFYLWYSSNVVEYSDAIKLHQNRITSFRVACEYYRVDKEEEACERYNAELRSKHIHFKPGVLSSRLRMISHGRTSSEHLKKILGRE